MCGFLGNEPAADLQTTQGLSHQNATSFVTLGGAMIFVYKKMLEKYLAKWYWVFMIHIVLFSLRTVLGDLEFLIFLFISIFLRLSEVCFSLCDVGWYSQVCRAER